MPEDGIHTAAFTKLLSTISEQLTSLTSRVDDMRERLIRLESHGYQERLKKLEDDGDSVRMRVTVLETRGQTFTAIIGSGAAILTSLITTAVVYLFKG